jgi:hypothetical protein
MNTTFTFRRMARGGLLSTPVDARRKQGLYPPPPPR